MNFWTIRFHTFQIVCDCSELRRRITILSYLGVVDLGMQQLVERVLFFLLLKRGLIEDAKLA